MEVLKTNFQFPFSILFLSDSFLFSEKDSKNAFRDPRKFREIKIGIILCENKFREIETSVSSFVKSK